MELPQGPLKEASKTMEMSTDAAIWDVIHSTNIRLIV